MNRLVALAAITGIAVLAVPAVASAGNDVARGNGTDSTDVFEEIAFNARSNFNGTEATGNVTFTEPDQDPDQKISGHVTCLSVIGNQATIAGVVTDISPGVFPGFTLQGFVMRAIDNTEIGLPDQVSTFFLTSAPPPPPSCAAGFVFFPQPLVDGQIVVKDATS